MQPTKNIKNNNVWPSFASAFVSVAMVITSGSPLLAGCPEKHQAPAPMKRSEIYKDVPFKKGEVSTFEVAYLGISVGYAWLRVRPPIKYRGAYHRVFNAEAKTGDWYSYAFTAKDKLQALSRPQDFAAANFYMGQDERTTFGNHLEQKKWLEFKQEGCTVVEKVLKVGEKSHSTKYVKLAHGSVDTLGAIYKLRSEDYKIGKTIKTLIYSSQKNWWLEAKPEAYEKITVPAGTFEAVRLDLKTFVGKDLEQKGTLKAWIAYKHLNRPLLKVEGEVKVGAIEVVLKEFRAGRD